MNIDKPDTLIISKRKIQRKLKPTDPDFVAPDGGWGWLVAFACGLSNLSTFLVYQQFGLIFSDKFQEIGITHTQTTTIMNINLACTSCVGIFNGPIYRRFSFRQVGLFGSSLVVGSLLAVTWCNSFWTYFTFYSLLFGTGVGLTQSANVLALNTYFKKNRTIATGLSWGITGIGPIVWPQVITVLMNCYGVEGTVLFFAGFAGNAIMCSLLLQPVHWHTKCRQETDVPLTDLSSKTTRVRSNSLPVNFTILKKPTLEIHSVDYIDSSSKSINALSDENRNLSINVIHGIQITKKLYSKSELTFNTNDDFTIKLVPNPTILNSTNSKSNSNCLMEFVKFFDLDVLKDYVYINIIFGMIFVYFVESNLNILTPVILKDFQFEKYEIATYMSTVGATDIIVRFSIPFVARKIKCNGRIYFLLGSLICCMGRIVLIHTQEFSISLFAAVVVGFGKGLLIIYVALIIPNHVSLQKLPAALGIYLAFFGIFVILMAPVAGWIRDLTQSYVASVHTLQMLVYIATLSWIYEYFSKKRKLINN